MLKGGLFRALFLLLIFPGSVLPKDPPPQVVVWPPSGTPVVRFTFGKFKGLGGSGSTRSYSIDTKVENLWDKKISEANFSLYLFDKNKVRIGEGWISISNAAPGEIIKFDTNVQTSGLPTSMEIVPRSLPAELRSYLPPKKISVTVNSVPQGAEVKLDGTELGTTPKIVEVGVGKHLLEFSKSGFNPGKFPLEIAPDDVSGGSLSYELGTSAHDTIELRDGSVLSGDLESISATDVVVRIGGTLQSLNRNQVKRITMVAREANNQ